MTTDVHRQPDLYPPSTTVVVYCGIFFPSHLSSGLSCHIYSHAMPSTAWFLVNSSLSFKMWNNNEVAARWACCECTCKFEKMKGLLAHAKTVHRKEFENLRLCEACMLLFRVFEGHNHVAGGINVGVNAAGNGAVNPPGNDGGNGNAGA